MQHLLVHLAHEAKVGGPMQFRWMYHVERAHKYLRAMVGNKARVEGCIAEAFILKEIAYFSSVYFVEEHNVNAPTMRYNVDEEPSLSDLPIFQSTGASASASSPYYFKPGERLSAYLYMYANIKEMDPYFAEFQRQTWTSKKQPSIKQLEKMRRDGIDGKPNFTDWFKIYCKEINGKVHEDLVQLSEGRVTVKSHGRMSRKLKHVAKGFAGKMIPSKARLFQGTSSTSSRRVALLRVRMMRRKLELGNRRRRRELVLTALKHAKLYTASAQYRSGQQDEEEDAGADEDMMGGDGSEEVVQRRGTRRSHYINPPPVPTTADKRLIRPTGDGKWEDMT
ncbi:hypothetical protein U9M48_040345 [Paspalum notatum var. saurae]|uniref:DUF4218 domain-containing protein n=1 Tax=Paspalum notatum var. saurae TaxID=547442 RepID=A0AAQ3UQV5_PASNO